MRRRLVRAALAAIASALVLATPALAHGDHDARPIARDLRAGPYTVSLWQVSADAATSMTPHLIVMVDPAGPPVAEVRVAVNSTPREVHPSATTANGWETMDGLNTGDAVAVSVSDGTAAYALGPVVVPPPPTSFLPVQELLYVSIVLTAATAVWVARRTTRAWRRPVASPGRPAPNVARDTR